MTPRLARTLALGLSLSFGAAAHAGDVLVVDAGGGGDHVDLQAAADAAADGDALLVRAGTYGPLRIANKGLVVAADLGAHVTVVGGILVRDTLVEHEVLLIGLELRGTKELVANQAEIRYALQLDVARGPVRVEACALLGASGWDEECGSNGCCVCPGDEPVRARLALDVSFTACTLWGGDGGAWFQGHQVDRGGDGFVGEGGAFSFHGCEVRGGRGGTSDSIDNLYQGGDGGAAARVLEHPAIPATTLFAAGSTFHAGAGGDGDPCLDLCGDGGYGMVLEGPQTRARLLETDVLGGVRGCPYCGPPYEGVDGRAFLRLAGARRVWIDGDARLLTATNPVRGGQVSDVVVLGVPGDLALLVAGAPLQTMQWARHGTLLVDGGLGQVVPLGVVPPTGTLTVQVPFGALPGGVESETVWTQGLCRDTQGQWWLASPSSVLWLDPAF